MRTRLEKEAQEKLTTEGWADKAKGLVHVSITDAIPLAVAELRSKKPAPSQVKVEPPLRSSFPIPNRPSPRPWRCPRRRKARIRFASPRPRLRSQPPPLPPRLL
ncbi:MAG: hypothetical protein WDN28_21690 [Chthoniobacter sp.]